MRRTALACAAAAFLGAAAVVAQSAPVDSPPEAEAPAASEWEFAASVYSYFVPQDHDYASATVTADHGLLHLEGRANYEGLDTGSLWVGTNFSFGKAVTFEVTPMLGGVFGATHGVAPGYHLTIDYAKLELYSEGEYLFDTDNDDDSFFYTWNELTYSPFEWLQAGLVSQRTRAYQTPLDIQRGLLVRGFLKSWTFGLYIFNFGWTDPTWVFSIGLDF
jgi:hypothetical protein